MYFIFFTPSLPPCISRSLPLCIAYSLPLCTSPFPPPLSLTSPLCLNHLPDTRSPFIFTCLLPSVSSLPDFPYPSGSPLSLLSYLSIYTFLSLLLFNPSSVPFLSLAYRPSSLLHTFTQSSCMPSLASQCSLIPSPLLQPYHSCLLLSPTVPAWMSIPPCRNLPPVYQHPTIILVYSLMCACM